MTHARIPSTAFADAWINVDSTENPEFFVKLLDSTRAVLLESARSSPAEFFAPLNVRPTLFDTRVAILMNALAVAGRGQFHAA